MSANFHHHENDDFDETEGLYPIRNLSKQERAEKNKQKQPAKPGKLEENSLRIAEQADDLSRLDFSYNASRHEREWIYNSLGEFFDQRWLDDILRLVKGGKEANVYQCLVNETVAGLDQPYLAAKIYRPRMFRNLKNDYLYREGRGQLDGDGRLIKDERALHAVAKKTEFGREVLHTSWIEHEVKTMELLEAAGADVPRIFARGNNAILMSFIGGPDSAAPVLHSVRLDARQARRLYERVIHNLTLMLDRNRVHGDLSAFNVLYWEGEITLIDFPQAIDPRINRNAYWIFERDVLRICEYFSRQGVKSDGHRLAADLWKAHHLKVVPDVHPGLLDVEDEADRSYWQRWNEEGRS